MAIGKLALFLLYTFLCQLVFSSSLPHLCPNDQALALLQLNDTFTINLDASYSDYYPKTVKWNRGTDCCSWDGVKCKETTGQVIELDLSRSQLRGKFHSNSSLFKLPNLKRLDLSFNNFSGSYISPKFGELSNLRHLDLSFSSFIGLIPAEISRLSKLHVLRIESDTYELRFEPHNFELLLKNLTQLRELDFDNVNISSTIPLNFSSYLTTLHLRNTQLYGTLPEGVFHLYNLESLYLTDNPQLTVRFPTTKWNSSASLMELVLYSVNTTSRIPESFGHLTSLRTLRIVSCNLSGSIPKLLWDLTNIENLYLGYNHLEGPISYFFRFGKISSCRFCISLRNNNFDGQLEFLSFNRSFNRIWTQLEFLDFSSNSITGPIPSN
ncbi:receptor-like protein Cf-9, partial [Solanum stenotomum]|uniref:receptor-like protein Cf-9 n=1 Tax=Solanum stenotomum TaxID=172797 RepID=UPI0020D04D50